LHTQSLGVVSGVNGHAVDSLVVTRADQAKRDFASVGDPIFFEYLLIPCLQVKRVV